MTFVAKFSDFKIPVSGWSDDRIETLKTMWADGQTASVIAGHLGTSRNAILGKVHRLHLDARRVTIRLPEMRICRPHKRVRFRPTKPRAHIEPQTLVGEPMPIPVYSVDALTRTNCRWPYGDPGAPGFHFCGAHAVSRHPYCGPHHRLAYQPKR